MNDQTTPIKTDTRDPLELFSDCHQGIIEYLNRLQQLSESSAQSPLSSAQRKTAAEIYRFFQSVIVTHHREEEEELFSEVRDSARSQSEDAQQALIMIDQLTAEHRDIEARWKPIEKQLKQLARGKPVQLNQPACQKLVADYLAHARFEEQQFLPLSAQLLGERGLSSLGLSLHMRHNPVKFPTYI